MDPIHPIIPIAPRIAPVTITPRAERARREQPQPDADEQRPRHDAQGREQRDWTDDETGDDPGPQVDVTA